MTSVRYMASLTGGLGERNSTSINTVSPLIVKQSDRRCELSVCQVSRFRNNGCNYLMRDNSTPSDYQSTRSSEMGFQINLHPNDFEDLFYVNIQESRTSAQGIGDRKWVMDEQENKQRLLTASRKDYRSEGSIEVLVKLYLVKLEMEMEIRSTSDFK
ncbi:hypothetical protein Tco_1506736 [Tanacetum coccineum]